MSQTQAPSTASDSVLDETAGVVTLLADEHRQETIDALASMVIEQADRHGFDIEIDAIRGAVEQMAKFAGIEANETEIMLASQKVEGDARLLGKLSGQSAGVDELLCAAVHGVSPFTTPDRLREVIADTVQLDAAGLQAAIGQLVVATSTEYPTASADARSVHDAAAGATVLLADRIPAGQETQALAVEIERHHGRKAAQAVLGDQAEELLGADVDLAAAEDGAAKNAVLASRVFVVSAHITDDHLEEGPEYCEFDVDAKFIDRVTDLVSLCEKHQLSQVNITLYPKMWGPAGVEESARLQGGELIVCRSGQFWYSDTPKYGSGFFQSKPMSVNELRDLLANSPAEIVFANQVVQDLYENDHSDEPSASESPIPAP